jgi:N-ethylmaleimide reductase
MKLLEPTSIGNIILKNRIAMAPMTRSRANDDGIVGPLTVLYYKQRASAALIISEGINISEQGKGSPLTPGIYNQDQIEAWQKVTREVHNEGGKIFAQLWHTGRVGHQLNKNGQIPIAPSAIAIKDQLVFTPAGEKTFETPQALSDIEIQQIILDYQQAAINAMEAGFDGGIACSIRLPAQPIFG